MFDTCYGNSQSLREASASSYKTEFALQAAVIAAMAASVAANSFTCTVAVNTFSGQDVNNVMRILSDSNFIVASVGNNIILTW